MPPHARMSLVAAAAAARAGRALLGDALRPARLARWGTELHDRFMLPHFVWQDFDDVVAELQRRRLSVRARLVRAALRVPLPAARRLRSRAASTSSCARRSSRGTCSARRARPAARRATSIRRSSGSQVHVTGLAGDRYVLTCNGRRAAAAADRHASASSSPACATAPGSRRRRCTRRSASHAPLVFDLVDTWMNRSLGGCQYHVAHPGGRNYDDLPGQRLRGRGAPPGALLPHRPHARER